MSNSISIKSRGLIIISGLLILTVGLYLIMTPATSKLKTPIENQLQAMQVEDIATAYSYTSQAFQKSTSLETFKRFINSYSGLRNNESVVFDHSSIKDDVGMVKATLVSRGGSGTAVTYQLVKEHNTWKIESMVIIPQGEDHPATEPVTTAANNQPAATTADTSTNSASTAPVTTAAPVATTTPATTTTPAAPDTSSLYEDTENNYSVHYPSAWEYARADDGELIFHKKDSDADNQTMLRIQPLAASNEAPHFTVQQLVEQGEEAIKAKAGGYKIVEDGLLPPRNNKNENFHGRYVVYSYTLDNDKTMKQLQVIYFKSPSRAKFVIDYTSPEEEFDADLPAVRAMISSFTVSG